MDDMIDLILTQASDPAQELRLRHEIAAHTTAVLSSAGRGDRSQVAQVEQAVQANPAGAFAFDATGSATLSITQHSWHAGRFEIVSLGDLRVRAQRHVARATDAQLRLWVFDGASPVTDIGSLQATNSNNTFFQVASQFNCLESPGPYMTRVANYFSDPTQGPRASIMELITCFRFADVSGTNKPPTIEPRS